MIALGAARPGQHGLLHGLVRCGRVADLDRVGLHLFGLTEECLSLSRFVLDSTQFVGFVTLPLRLNRHHALDSLNVVDVQINLFFIIE